MKIQKTLFIAATAMLSLCACSSDDTSTNSEDQKSQIYVTIDELEFEDDFGATRSYLSRDMKTHMWVELDSMRVYDNILQKYDMYKFNWKDETHNAGVFGRTNNPSNIQEAKWALFPHRDVASGHWDMDEETFINYTTAWIRICCDKNGNVVPLKFSQIEDGQPLFADRLPRWGQVTATDNGSKLYTNLSYLTAVLRLQLAGTQGKADHLKVQMLQGDTPLPIAGQYKTHLAINDVKQVAALSVENYMPNEGGGTAIIVDLTGATGSIVAYVPLVTTSVPVDIVVSASNDGGQTYTEFKRFKNKIVTRGKVYGNANEYVF